MGLPALVFSYKLRYIVGFWLVEIAISTNQKPTIYRNLYENTDLPGMFVCGTFLCITLTWANSLQETFWSESMVSSNYQHILEVAP